MRNSVSYDPPKAAFRRGSVLMCPTSERGWRRARRLVVLAMIGAVLPVAIPPAMVHAAKARSCGSVFATVAGSRLGGRVEAVRTSCVQARRVIRYSLTHHSGNAPRGPAGWGCARGGSPEVTRVAIECTRRGSRTRARLVNR